MLQYAEYITIFDELNINNLHIVITKLRTHWISNIYIESIE